MLLHVFINTRHIINQFAEEIQTIIIHIMMHYYSISNHFICFIYFTINFCIVLFLLYNYTYMNNNLRSFKLCIIVQQKPFHLWCWQYWGQQLSQSCHNQIWPKYQNPHHAEHDSKIKLNKMSPTIELNLKNVLSRLHFCHLDHYISVPFRKLHCYNKYAYLQNNIYFYNINR